MTTTPRTRAHRSAGFTVIEVVVALFVLAIILVAVLGLFDASNRIARAQIHIAEMQQSLRIGQDTVVRMTRMAARGWALNRIGWKQVDMVRWRDNVGNAAFITTGSDPTLKIKEGTDVLSIQGVVEGSIIEPSNPSGVFLEPKLKIEVTSPSGIKQDLEQLQRAKDAGGTVRVLLVSAMGEVGSADGTIDNVTSTSADITYDPATSTQPWVSLGHPISLTGILEEYAFYVRDNNGSPRLSMARFRPGTTLPYGGKVANLRKDIADDILDLQIALAVDKYTDTNGDAQIDERDKGDDVIAADEWFLNVSGGPAVPALGTKGDLTYVRIDTLARTEGRDIQYLSPAITAIENHTYGELATPATPADVIARTRHRRLLQTVVDLRNM
jgi:hypothetical protein